MQQRNTKFLVFMLASFGFMMLWQVWHSSMFPPAPPENDPNAAVEEAKATESPVVRAGLDAVQIAAEVTRLVRQREREKQRALEEQATPADQLVRLGSDDPASKFHIGVQFDPRGAGVRRVLLNKFQREDEDGRPGEGELELVPPEATRRIPANVLYHFGDLLSDRPVDELGRLVWQVKRLDDKTLDDGRAVQTVEFTAEAAGVEIVKRFTLTEGEYHLGLEVDLTRQPGAGKRFRYQLTGANGLPIEGKWFTSFFRTALIAQEQNGAINRDYQDVRQIGLWGGGNAVERAPNNFFRYAGVVVQYFASVVVVDQRDGQAPFISRARPTLERGVMRGTIKSYAPDLSSLVLHHGNQDVTFQIPDPALRLYLGERPTDVRASVTYHTDRHGKEIAEQVTPEFMTQPLWVDDVNVRLTSETLDLEVEKTVTHRYLLYNGPVKVSLLSQMTGDRAVPPEVVARYLNTFHLNTLTDYQSPGPIGAFSSAIYWTPLVINTTNLMHWVLDHLYHWVPNYGLCIILLTVIVRTLMFPLSLKQAKTMQKMQALAPELKAMNERYKDDRQAMAAAQMELYRKHGVNPFGTCWVLLLQLPIFMGLWYALQESIFFRLAPFWPTWIDNLAAPDMLWHWGRGIPIISRDYDYNGWFYLGPFLNILPLIAIGLMLVQQKMMSPPPTNEQEEANQRVMTIMMCVMGLLFYKVAAGLCVYFIVSSLWGVAERQFLPKPAKPGERPAESATVAIVYAGATTGRTGSTAVTPATTSTPSEPERGRSKKGKKGRRAAEQQKVATPEPEPEAEPTTTLGKMASWWRKRRKAMSEWWAEILRQAEKK